MKPLYCSSRCCISTFCRPWKFLDHLSFSIFLTFFYLLPCVYSCCSCHCLYTKFGIWAVYYLQRLSRMDAWTRSRILRIQMPSRARFLHERPWRETWQSKAIRQASKDTQRLPASAPPHHPFSSPFLIPTPSPCFIHTSDGEDRGTLEGRSERVHLQAIPLRVYEIASFWMDCQWPGGSSSQTAPALCSHPSDFPHQLLPWDSSLTVCHLCPADPRPECSLSK